MEPPKDIATTYGMTSLGSAYTHIVFIDDQETTRLVFARQIKKLYPGVVLTMFDSANKAKPYILSLSSNGGCVMAVCSDLHLGRGAAQDGDVLTKWVCKARGDWAARVTAIICTGNQEAALRDACDGVLYKPYSLTDLKITLQSHLQNPHTWTSNYLLPSLVEVEVK